MDSAEALTFQGVLENNNSRLDRQEEQMLATGRAVQALVVQVSELTTQIQQLRMPTAPLPPPVPWLFWTAQLNASRGYRHRRHTTVSPTYVELFL